MNTLSTRHEDWSRDLRVVAIPFDRLKGLLQESLPDIGPLPVEKGRPVDPFVFVSIERLQLECDARNLTDAPDSERVLVAIVASLLRHSDVRSVRTTVRGGLAPWQVRRSTEALKDRMAETISLTHLADDVGLSPSHFSRAFKQSLGVPPHRYRTRVRLERACHLLETTSAPVTEIALTVGYESSQALARVFARDLGLTPTEWRREQRQS